MDNDFRILNGLKILPLKAFRVFGDTVSVGEPMAFQQLIYMVQVEAPSSMIVWKMAFSLTTT